MARTCRSCLTKAEPRKRNCQACGKKLPKKRRPKHAQALDFGREVFIRANGGLDRCGICGTERKPGGRALHRDHDHKTGAVRGILCFRCNAALRPYMDKQWLEKAAAYLGRNEAA